MKNLIIFISASIITYAVLLSFSDYIKKIGKEKGIKFKFINIVLAIFLTIPSTVAGSVVYDYIKLNWFEEEVRNGILRGNYPFFRESNEEYGNFKIALEQQGNRTIDNFEISIRYPNSQYEKVMIWSYTEPQWFVLEPLEYEITIKSEDGQYIETYPFDMSKEIKTFLTLPVYDN